MEFILTGIAKEIKYNKLVLVLDKESINKQKNITGEYKNIILCTYSKYIGLKLGKPALMSEFVGHFVKVRIKKENYFMRDNIYSKMGSGYRYKILEIYQN